MATPRSSDNLSPSVLVLVLITSSSHHHRGYYLTVDDGLPSPAHGVHADMQLPLSVGSRAKHALGLRGDGDRRGWHASQIACGLQASQRPQPDSGAVVLQASRAAAAGQSASHRERFGRSHLCGSQLLGYDASCTDVHGLGWTGNDQVRRVRSQALRARTPTHVNRSASQASSWLCGQGHGSLGLG
jgi:hypothetical protein